LASLTLKERRCWLEGYRLGTAQTFRRLSAKYRRQTAQRGAA